MEKGKKVKEVSIAIILEKDDKKAAHGWMEQIASDFGPKMIIHTTEVPRMYQFIRQIHGEGYQIKSCALIGHGTDKPHHIGELISGDIDYDNRLTNYMDDEFAKYAVEKKIANVKENIKKPANKEKLTKLNQHLDELNNEFNRLGGRVKNSKDKLDELDDLANAFAPDALISVVNCRAGSKKDHQLMTDIGKTFLRKNGGNVIGFDRDIHVFTAQHDWEFLRNLSAGNLFTCTWGNPVVVKIKHESGTGKDDKHKSGGVTGHPEGHKTDHPESTATHCNGHNHKPDCHCGWGGK